MWREPAPNWDDLPPQHAQKGRASGTPGGMVWDTQGGEGPSGDRNFPTLCGALSICGSSGIVGRKGWGTQIATFAEPGSAGMTMIKSFGMLVNVPGGGENDLLIRGVPDDNAGPRPLFEKN